MGDRNNSSRAPLSSRRPILRGQTQEARQSRSYAAGVDEESLQPFLTDNALRRLGFETSGGISSLFPVAGIPERGHYYPSGYGEEAMIQDIIHDSVFGTQYVDAMLESAPQEKREAFESSVSSTLLPSRSTALGPNVNTPAVFAHELGHAGLSAIRDLYQQNPEKVERYLGHLAYEPLMLSAEGDRASHSLEEAIVEVADDPDHTWWTPEGEERTLEYTIQMLDDAARKNRADAFNQELERLALEELARLRMGP